jgi:hypothetical protein
VLFGGFWFEVVAQIGWKNLVNVWFLHLTRCLERCSPCFTKADVDLIHFLRIGIVMEVIRPIGRSRGR